MGMFSVKVWNNAESNMGNNIHQASNIEFPFALILMIPCREVLVKSRRRYNSKKEKSFRNTIRQQMHLSQWKNADKSDCNKTV